MAPHKRKKKGSSKPAITIENNKERREGDINKEREDNFVKILEVPTKPKPPKRPKMHTRNVSSEKTFKRADVFHRIKHEVLAPFLAQLLLAKRFQTMLEDLDDEGTQTATDLDQENDSSDKEVEMASSHHEDWRSLSPLSDSD